MASQQVKGKYVAGDESDEGNISDIVSGVAASMVSCSLGQRSLPNALKGNGHT